MRALRAVAVATVGLFLASCGLTVPVMEPLSNTPDASNGARMLTDLTAHIHCEMRDAVYKTYHGLSNVRWLSSWSAKVSLTVTIDEKSAVNPGLTLTRLFPDLKTTLSNGKVVSNPRTFQLGLGGQVASTAAREVQISWYEVFGELLEEGKKFQGCPRNSEAFFEGNLRIYDTLYSGVYLGSLGSNAADPFKDGGRLAVVQHNISFYLQSDGNISPSWKFVEVAANTGGSLFDFSRNRKDNLLITMGPSQVEDAKRALRPRPVTTSRSIEDSHLAKQIGDAVSNSIAATR